MRKIITFSFLIIFSSCYNLEPDFSGEAIAKSINDIRNIGKKNGEEEVLTPISRNDIVAVNKEILKWKQY